MSANHQTMPKLTVKKDIHLNIFIFNPPMNKKSQNKSIQNKSKDIKFNAIVIYRADSFTNIEP